VKITDAGLLAGARYIESPNCDERPPATLIDLLVIHNISLPPGEFGGRAIIELFTNCLDPGAHPYYCGIAHQRVSAHFLIRRDGELIQFVRCEKRAWHAGESSWRGRGRCNDFSLGIELEGSDDVPFTDVQYGALAELTLAIKASYPIEHVVGHCDIAPDRKTDPGPCFDWVRYRQSISGSRCSVR
jgi:N-acetyl-anhydromuramoyl-L-alanine amidase